MSGFAVGWFMACGLVIQVAVSFIAYDLYKLRQELRRKQ